MYFDAPIDTTFALYKVPFHSFNAIRTNRPYTAKHMPWYYFDFEDMPVEEIATIMNLSASNVKIKLFRSRKKLYEQLNGLLKEHEAFVLS